ncbi:tyrosine-type recombinase/integrase [Streptomyces sp. NPDC007148]|uniref:tyrosine-type recombinase/integrase n=1 Tax=Streptomyces sp. NPDC007148 TaxID=3364775 RepID=UPI00367BB216
MAEIKKVVLRGGAVRYRFVVDVGYEPKKDKTTGEPVLDDNGQPVMKRRQLTVTKKTKTEAKTELARIENERAAGTFIAPNEITVAQWLDQWLEYKRRDVEETTIRTYKLALVHVYDRLGHIRLQELTEDQVRDFIDEVVATGRRKGGEPGTRLAVSTAEGILTRLREALARAVVRKLVPVNVAMHVRVALADKKIDKRERPALKPWTVSEVQTFIKGIEQDRLYSPLLLSLMGLRPAEVCGQKWPFIDLQVGVLEMTNTRTMIGNKDVLEKDAKTAAGERGLPLPSKVLEALKKFKAQQAREKLAAGEAYTDSGYVVVDELGVVLNTRQLREHTYRLMRRLGLRQVRLYDARHSCLTYLANNGVPDHILARWAGHTSAAFTKKKYVHVEPEDMRDAATAWDAFHSG